MIGEKKLIQHLAAKSFSVFGVVPFKPLNTLKTFFPKLFYQFL